MSHDLDIYTKRVMLVPSDEHIVLNALGGRRKHSLIDKTTNDILGSTIDAALATTLHVIRVLLDATSGDGESPPPIRRAPSPTGDTYDLLPGGKPEISHPRLSFEDSGDGRVQLTGRARSMSELRRHAKRKLEQHGVSLDALEAGSTTVESKAPRLHVDCSFTPDSWRAVAKMACNLLAIERRNMFLEPAFDAVREFVLRGGDAWNFIAINTTPIVFGEPPASMGALDHVLVVCGDHATGQVRALVVLFGHVQLVVRLGTASLNESFVVAHRVDQVGRRERHNDDADTSLSVPEFVSLSHVDQTAWFDALEGAMNRIFHVAMAAVDRRTVSELVAKSMSETLGKADGRSITKVDVGAFANAVAERYVRAFCSEDDD